MAPRGEDEVRASLLDAASRLFAARGPSAVSVRVIAAEAGVNHGLVHHYFGSKGALLTAVLDGLAAEAAAEIAALDPDDADDAASVYDAGGATARHSRILAHLLLEARDPAEVQTDFPAVHALVDRFRGQGMKAREARQRAAQVTALVLGWQLYESFLTAAAGLDAGPGTRRRLLDDAVHRLLR